MSSEQPAPSVVVDAVEEVDLKTAGNLAKVKSEEKINLPKNASSNKIELVQKLQDAWQATQKRSFTAWINFQIRPENVAVVEIADDLSDGVILATLLRVLSQEKLRVNNNPKMRIHKMENVSVCLKFISEKGVKLVNISAEEIVDKNIKIILGTIWLLIRKFKIEGLQEDDAAGNDALLLWVQRKVKDYGIRVHNFHTSWQSGLALAAIIHSTYPNILNYHKLPRNDPSAVLEECFDVSDKNLGIPRMLEISDLVGIEKPDDHSVLTYISAHYQVQQQTKDWIAQFAVTVPSLKQTLTDAINKLGEPITVDTREALERLVKEFEDDCAKVYNVATEDFNKTNKYTTALKKMGLPEVEFDPTPFEEIERLHNNMLKLIQQRKQDLVYADEYLKDIEAFLAAYNARLKELTKELNIIRESMDSLPSDLPERLALLRGHSDTLASQKRHLEELAHTKNRLEEKKVDAASLDTERELWEKLTQRVKEQLDTLQLAEFKLKQYAKDAPTLNTWMDKATLQLDNLFANAESVLEAESNPSADELKALVDQFTIINVVYTNKKKDYAKLTELVASIHEAGLKETSYTKITFVEISEKWETLQTKFKSVASKVGVADDKINLSDKCARLVKEIEEFLANEERSRKERKATRITDNKVFEDLLAQVNEKQPLVDEKKKILTDEGFLKEIPNEIVSSLDKRLGYLENALNQEKNDFAQRKQDAELYATRSRELDTWFKASTDSVSPVDKPIASVDKAHEEIQKIDSDSKDQYAEYNRLVDIAWMLNDANMVENIFGGLLTSELADRWDELAKLYDDRKKFLALAQDQLELAGSVDQILDRERKYLEASKALEFSSPKEVETDKKGLQKHKGTVIECHKRILNPNEQQQQNDPALESKLTTLLADYEAEIARKAQLTELFQNYAKTADDLAKRLSDLAVAFSPDSIEHLSGAPDGASKFQSTVHATAAKLIDMKTELGEFDKIVDALREKKQKENVYTSVTKEDVHEKHKSLEDLLEQIKENLDEFVKLASCVASYASKLNNIRTDKLDDKKSVVLTNHATTLKEQEPAIQEFSTKPVLGNPLLKRFESLGLEFNAAIQYWVIEEEKLELFLASAAKFEEVVINQTNVIQTALAEIGRNLVAEYQAYLEEFKGYEVQYKDLGMAMEHLKLIDPTTRAEPRFAELTNHWNELQEAMERMRKRIYKGFTPEAEILRAKDYINSLRGPKFVAHEVDKSAVDAAMDNNVTRIVLLGDTAGKTSIISKYVKDIFPDSHVATTSDQHTEAIADLGDKKYRIEILDTCPTEDRSSATRLNWYNWGDAFMFVYSVNNLKSFENAYTVFTELQPKRIGKPFGMILVANESDNDTNREVPALHGKSSALTMMCKYVETSAKTGSNVPVAFRELLRDTAIKKAVSARVEREKEDPVKMTKSKSKKSKTELLAQPLDNSTKSLTADANVDWRSVRLNQLLVLYELQKEESNRYCADCQRENPDWVARGFMVLLCVQCAHVHKMHILNPKIPKPRNLLIESFTQEEIVEVTALCNGRANMVLERVIPKNKSKPNPGDPREVKVAWIKSKYIAHEFYLSMNNEINSNSFQFQNHISKKYARDKLIPTRSANDKAPAVRVIGPKSNTSNEVVKGDFFAASSISTFPAGDADESKVDGGDIVDKWGIDFGKNHLFAVIADGVGWGESPKKSATNATEEFLSFVDLNFHKLTTIEDGAAMLQKSILVAHDSTTKDLDAKSVINYWEVGTTALLGGMMMYEKHGQGFLCVSVGNCKVFLARYGKTNKVIDITSGSRDYSLHEDDPGGCIGPQQEAGAPDLRNLQVFYTPVEVGDILIMMTDGVFQNYDPEFLGLLPKDAGYEKKPNATWKDLRPKKVNKLKSAYVEGLLERTLDKVRTPSQIEQTLLEHARLVTIPRRAFMEREGKTPPPNFESYPGRLDHTTVMCFTVAREYNPNA